MVALHLVVGVVEVQSCRPRCRYRFARGGWGYSVGSRGSDGEGESMYQNSGRHRITAPPFLIKRSDILRRRSKPVPLSQREVIKNARNILLLR